ncbi:hypothetical protein V7114_11610 [Neobacillus niacini]|uniref:hypothetical protein n=1 Tax=Neobacillus niacini TaxID=86668 RepID=UPI002FFF97AB
MGLTCSCGARTNPTSSGEISFLFDDGETRSGTLTINVDVCEDRLEISTFTATFVDQSSMVPNRNFVFTSTEVTGVDCILVNNQCRVVINGMGHITGDPTPRGFFVVISDLLTTQESLEVFNISLFSTNINSPLIQAPLTFFGCPTS